MDNHILEDSSFSWLVEIQTIFREFFSIFNWAFIQLFKTTKMFLQICKDLDVQMKKLTNFQITRFTDSVCFAFINLCISYLAVGLALVNVVASKQNSSAVKDRSKAKEAKCVLRKINSWVFCLSLSG